MNHLPTGAFKVAKSQWDSSVFSRSGPTRYYILYVTDPTRLVVHMNYR